MIGKVKLPLGVEGYSAILAKQYGSFAPAVLNEYKLENSRTHLSL
jgi:hypothetical protein